MRYVIELPPCPTFVSRGLKGFQFGPLMSPELDIYLLDVTRGHDTFLRSRKITRLYYVVAGHGYFTIEDARNDVEPGMLIEIPPNVEYSYSGSMRLLVIGHPRWFKGNEEVTKNNPDVAAGMSLSSLMNKVGLRRRETRPGPVG
jgi:hypothetical protein